jgi:hypothetical protein
VASSRREVPATQFALVTRERDIGTAEPDGSDLNFTDQSRWRMPFATPRLQYLCGDEDVARATFTAMAQRSGVAIANLRPGRGPHLLDVELDDTHAYDLTSPAQLQAEGLPPDYPRGSGTSGVRDQCRRTGDRLVAAGEAAFVTRPTYAAVVSRLLTLAVVGRLPLRTAARRRFQDWFPG